MSVGCKQVDLLPLFLLPLYFFIHHDPSLSLEYIKIGNITVILIVRYELDLKSKGKDVRQRQCPGGGGTRDRGRVRLQPETAQEVYSQFVDPSHRPGHPSPTHASVAGSLAKPSLTFIVSISDSLASDP